ncbi:hypothetical protein CF336_g8611 [Tilletia laevis]|nr:hypothetical protein CF336_g8611 [Tilletia laevis]
MLLWVGIATRGDVAFAAGYLGRHSAAPTYEHWNMDTTHDIGLYFAKNTVAKHLEGWSDADYAGDRDTRRSTTGYAFKVFGALVSWGARRQDIVATSTVHAEYVAMAESARENAYLRTLLSDLHHPVPGPTTLHGDNEGALTLVTKPAFHQRTKHIEVRWHYIREAQESRFARRSSKPIYSRSRCLHPRTRSIDAPLAYCAEMRWTRRKSGSRNASVTRTGRTHTRDATLPTLVLISVSMGTRLPIPIRTVPRHRLMAPDGPVGAAGEAGTWQPTRGRKCYARS